MLGIQKIRLIIYVIYAYQSPNQRLLIFWDGASYQGKRISNPIDTVLLGFTQSTNKFKITILSQGVGLTFSSFCGQKHKKLFDLYFFNHLRQFLLF
jgi:hypothetical protein